MFWEKKDRCESDGCVNRKAYSIVFEDGVRGKYCEECKLWLEAYSNVKSVEELKEVQK